MVFRHTLNWLINGVSPYGLRLSPYTECKKFIALATDDAAEKERVVQRLMFWLSRACTFARQRQHMLWTPDVAECPDAAFLERSRLDEAPDWKSVRTDHDLDAHDVPLSLTPPASWLELERLEAIKVERGRGRGAQGRARHGGRGQKSSSKGRGRCQQAQHGASGSGQGASASTANRASSSSSSSSSSTSNSDSTSSSS